MPTHKASEAVNVLECYWLLCGSCFKLLTFSCLDPWSVKTFLVCLMTFLAGQPSIVLILHYPYKNDILKYKNYILELHIMILWSCGTFYSLFQQMESFDTLWSTFVHSSQWALCSLYCIHLCDLHCMCIMTTFKAAEICAQIRLILLQSAKAILADLSVSLSCFPGYLLD